MRAAVLHGREDVRIQTVPDAPAPDVGEVRLDVIACALCGTDVHEYLHAPVFAPLQVRHHVTGHKGPMIPGHEFLGVVSDVGEGVEGLRVGSRVVAGAGDWCGSCPACRAGRTNLCERYSTYGLHRNGGMAEQVTVPAQMCVEVPEELSDEDAVLAQPIAVAMHAVRRSGAVTGDRVAVVGAGAIGSLVIACLADAGIAPTVFDIDESRLATARELGAAEAVLLSAGGSGPSTDAPFEIAFDTTGAPDALNDCIALVGRGGRAVAVGLPAGEVAIDSHDAVVREVDIVTSSAHVCRDDLPAALSLLGRRTLSNTIVDRTIDLEDLVDSGLRPLAARQVPGKVVVRIARDAGDTSIEMRQASTRRNLR